MEKGTVQDAWRISYVMGHDGRTCLKLLLK
jgi:hypothetical protein